MSTITTLGTSDTGSTSRGIINTNFSNLNTDKLESSVIQRVYKSADETVNNSTTYQNDDALLFAVGANEVWAFTLAIFFTSGTVPDIKFFIAAPASTTGQWAPSNSSTAITNFEGGYIASGNGVVNDRFFISGVAITAGTAGNVQLQWAQNTATVSDTKVLKGSYIIATRLA